MMGVSSLCRFWGHFIADCSNIMGSGVVIRAKVCGKPLPPFHQTIRKTLQLCKLSTQRQSKEIEFIKCNLCPKSKLGLGKIEPQQSTNIGLRLKLKQISAVAIVGCMSQGAYYFLNIKTPKFSNKVHAAVHAGRDNFIADIVEKAGPAVVFLEIKGRHALTGRPATLSNGSGFIVRSNGVILTNAHVVANKSTVSVKLQDGRAVEGEVTAVDPISDLAAVKIHVNNLPTIPLDKSSEVRPGEWVLAMGSPLSLSNTVTCGIVSSVQRASRDLGLLRNKDMDYIQTDAVINFGNSGGPLVNLEGRAIGINTMKVTTGISFAIPSDYAIKFLAKAEHLMQKGRTENGFLKRRYMGITMLTLSENVIRDLRNSNKISNYPDVEAGVLVYKVIIGTPAHFGGILAGDIIIDINGTEIKTSSDVYDAVEKSDLLKVTVVRDSTKKTFSINTQETI